jgi:hypothetical protein
MAGTGILALLAKPKGKASKEAELGGDMGEAMGGGDEVASALREMFDALKGGDDEGAALAFRRAKSACDDSYEDEEESPESGPGSAMDDLDL